MSDRSVDREWTHSGPTSKRLLPNVVLLTVVWLGGSAAHECLDHGSANTVSTDNEPPTEKETSAGDTRSPLYSMQWEGIAEIRRNPTQNDHSDAPSKHIVTFAHLSECISVLVLAN
ncbi:hypothetical protein B0H10DRAFT_2186361 [Mycena sp. CBHHK59/15]|nr:hypothetical protein B0H10DRAFT_2186361 [Mycena sp. CBHHK59/15]